MTIVATSARLSACWVTMTAVVIAVGPVGPDICAGVPPSTAAKNPTTIAPYNPATGPKPEATPKAEARGKATTAEAIPPKMSPRRVFRSNIVASPEFSLGVAVGRLRALSCQLLLRRQPGKHQRSNATGDRAKTK